MSYNNIPKIINAEILAGKLPVMFLKLSISARSSKFSKRITIGTKLFGSTKFQSKKLESNGYHKRVF
jgi:hypothetical protein